MAACLRVCAYASSAANLVCAVDISDSLVERRCDVIEFAGKFTAPYPERKAIVETPIIPTRPTPS